MRLTTKLRPYQREAVEKSRPHAGFAFYCEPRTGKTAIALAVAIERRAKRVLIVCPPVAVQEWGRQIPVHVADPCEFEIVTLGSLRPRIRKLRRWNPDLMIIDESHRIKRRGTKQSRACRTMGKNVPNRLLLTGTPIGQGSQDAWSQLNFLDREAFPDYASFATRYLVMGGYFRKKVVGHRNVEELAQIINGYSFRVTLNDAQGFVTRVQRRVHQVPMTPYQREVYRTAEAGMIELACGRQIDSSMMLTQATKLQQIAGGFVILPHKEGVAHLSSEKLTVLRRLLADQVKPVVVVARFVHELDAIVDLCRDLKRSVQRIGGGYPFSGTFDSDVLVMQIQAGGVSIDLAAADRIIWFSWNYSHLEHEQARFRILSYNKPKINYDYLVTEDSVDELLYETVRGKKVFASVLIDHYKRKEKWETNSKTKSTPRRKT